MDVKETRETTGAGASGAEQQRPRSHTARLLSLIVGDALVFLIFAALGRRSHGEENTIVQTVLTALPFAAGWFLVSPFVGAYRRGLEERMGKMATRTLLAWVASWPVGLLFRGIFVDQGVPPLSFALVTLVVNAALLLLWRVPFAFARGLKR